MQHDELAVVDWTGQQALATLSPVASRPRSESAASGARRVLATSLPQLPGSARGECARAVLAGRAMLAGSSICEYDAE